MGNRAQRIPSWLGVSTPTKAEYICADQPVTLTFRLRKGGGPYIPDGPPRTRNRRCFYRGLGAKRPRSNQQRQSPSPHHLSSPGNSCRRYSTSLKTDLRSPPICSYSAIPVRQG